MGKLQDLQTEVNLAISLVRDVGNSESTRAVREGMWLEISDLQKELIMAAKVEDAELAKNILCGWLRDSNITPKTFQELESLFPKLKW